MLISIIVSIYNGEKTLERCLKSLIEQTGHEYEIILIDDGSTDATGRICNHYAEENERVSVYHRENGGLSEARKTGLHYARGEYVLFFDCDDYASPTLIEELVNKIGTTHSDMVLFDYYVEHSAENQIKKSLNLPIELLTEYDPATYTINSIGNGWNQGSNSKFAVFLWTRCIKRSCIKDEMFVSERKCYTEDMLFNMAIGGQIKTLSYIEKPLYYYCITENSLTNRYRRNMWDMLLYRQHWLMRYCEKYGYINKAQSFIERSWWSAIMMACDNACSSGTISDARKEMKVIRENKESIFYLGIIRNKYSLMSRKEKIKFRVISLRLYNVYYLIKSIGKQT